MGVHKQNKDIDRNNKVVILMHPKFCDVFSKWHQIYSGVRLDYIDDFSAPHAFTDMC